MKMSFLLHLLVVCILLLPTIESFGAGRGTGRDQEIEIDKLYDTTLSKLEKFCNGNPRSYEHRKICSLFRNIDEDECYKKCERNKDRSSV